MCHFVDLQMLVNSQVLVGLQVLVAYGTLCRCFTSTVVNTCLPLLFDLTQPQQVAIG
jgi:hypothetical protein